MLKHLNTKITATEGDRNIGPGLRRAQTGDSIKLDNKTPKEFEAVIGIRTDNTMTNRKRAKNK